MDRLVAGTIGLTDDGAIGPEGDAIARRAPAREVA
jgi:hypothetical protein